MEEIWGGSPETTRTRDLIEAPTAIVPVFNKSRRLSQGQRVGSSPRPQRSSSLWDRRQRKIALITARPDAADRFALLLARFAEDLGDREVDRLVDGVIDTPAEALALLDHAGAER